MGVWHVWGTVGRVGGRYSPLKMGQTCGGIELALAVTLARQCHEGRRGVIVGTRADYDRVLSGQGDEQDPRVSLGGGNRAHRGLWRFIKPIKELELYRALWP